MGIIVTEVEDLDDENCHSCGEYLDGCTIIDCKDLELFGAPWDIPFNAQRWMEYHKCNNCGKMYMIECCNY
jgi:hypothetical protein